MSYIRFINTVIACLSKRINRDNEAVIKLFLDDFSKGVGYIRVHNPRLIMFYKQAKYA